MTHGTSTPGERSRGRGVLLWALAAAVLIGSGATGGIYTSLDRNVHGVDIDGAIGGDRPANPHNGSQDILILGSDSRAGANRKLGGGGDLGGTARSDTTLVLHIPGDGRRATAVSIPRDTLITRPSCRKGDGTTLPPAQRVMFNSVYTLGGPACVVKTVETLSDVRIDHYLEIDFTGFKDLVDALGGVTVTTRRPIHDPRSGLDLEAGTHRLDGTQALAFVRTRHGIGDGSDLGRIGLQQQFMLALLDEIRAQHLLTSPARLYKVADAATRSLTTDSELDSLTALVGFAKKLRTLNTGTLETVMLPVRYDTIDPNRVVPAQPQASALWQAIRADREVPASARKSPASAASSPR